MALMATAATFRLPKVTKAHPEIEEKTLKYFISKSLWRRKYETFLNLMVISHKTIGLPKLSSVNVVEYYAKDFQRLKIFA
jgi:hypothetical protein